jgi:4-amino-4-deoxy-L-arabinose transferase-like glycosyltransferase
VNATEVATVYEIPPEAVARRASQSNFPVVAVALGSLALALFRTRALPLIDRDEGRYAEAAREMLASGDWLVPRLFGVPYLEKPPLYYWLTAAAYPIAGVDELGARLVSALAAAAGVLMIGLLAKRCFGPRAGLLAATVLATSGMYFVLARVGITDMLFTALLTAALTSYFVAQTDGRSYLPFWLLAAGATLTKGPVAPVLCGLVVLAYLASSSRLIRLYDARFWLGFPVFLAVIATWFSLVEIRYPGFLRFYIYKEHMLRVAGDEHREAFYWYLPWLLVGQLPWTGAFIAALPAIRERVRSATVAGNAARFAFVWATVVFAFFSVPRGKLAPYILPMFPPLALLFGDALDRWLDADTAGRDGRNAWMTRAMPRAFASVGIGLLVAPLALPILLRLSPVSISPISVLSAAALSSIAGGVILRCASIHGPRPVQAIVASMIVLQISAVWIAPPLAHYLTAKPVIERLQARRAEGHEVVLYGGYFPNVPFYLQYVPPYVFGNRELDFGISLEGPGSAVLRDLRHLQARLGDRPLLIVLRTRARDLHALMHLPGTTRLLYRGRSSSLVEHLP